MHKYSIIFFIIGLFSAEIIKQILRNKERKVSHENMNINTMLLIKTIAESNECNRFQWETFNLIYYSIFFLLNVTLNS